MKSEDNFEEMSIQIDKYRVDAIDGLQFPVYHVKPEKPNGKKILFLHGHDDLGIMGALLERHDKVRYHKMIPLKLAKEGYDVYAPEFIGSLVKLIIMISPREAKRQAAACQIQIS